jgi:murein DD-endopeptidase MepM/ murein hydrolase activator NlpD
MSQHGRVICLAALMASLPAAAQPVPPEHISRAVAHYSQAIEDRKVHGRLGASFDARAVEREIRSRFAAGEDQKGVVAWLQTLLSTEELSFTEIGVTHDESATYRLPYDPRQPRLLASGVGGGPSHSGPDRYSYDFIMPRGTRVLAARKGSVVRTLDGYHGGGTEDRFKQRANAVLVLHSDGTYAEYGHLSPGVIASPGDDVAVGTLLGYSGNTGYSGGPHLHFSVRARDTATTSRTVPIRFVDSSGATLPLVPGNRYPQRKLLRR